jgi:uncharacterized caspase-like protein
MRAIQLVALIGSLSIAALSQKSILPTSGRKVALAVGNAGYGETALKNPVNDARAIAGSLTSLGFTTDLALDANFSSLDAAIDRFVTAVHPGDVALFYYSGHGIELNHENYLVPVDFRARDEAESKRQAYSANVLLEKLESRKPRMTIVVLDACRNNPFGRTRGGGGGLAIMQAGTGVYIAFAAAPGQTASDNPAADNGLFTGQLLHALDKPDMDINQVFDEVRAGVSAASGGKQVPWSVSSVIGVFVFRDIASQQRQAQTQRARLEAELASLKRERTDTQASATERQRQEAERQKADLEQRVRMQRLEEERLAKEIERRKQLQAEGTRPDNESDSPVRITERRQEESNIAELRRKVELERAAVAEEKMGAFTLAKARQEVIDLRQKLEAAKRSVDEQRRQAIENLDQEYAPRRQKAAVALAKDTFESTVEFQARVKKQADARSSLEAKYSAERSAMDRRYSEEGASQAALFQRLIGAIESRSYPAPGVRPQAATYDADNQVFTLRVEDAPFFLQLEREQARELYARKDLLSIDLTVPYYDSGSPKLPDELHVKDPVSGQSYTAKRSFILKVSSAPEPTVEAARHPVVRARLGAAFAALAKGDHVKAITYFTDVLQAGGSVPLPLLHYDSRLMKAMWLHPSSVSLNLTGIHFDPDGAAWQAGGWVKCSQAAFTVRLADIQAKLITFGGGSIFMQVTATNPARPKASVRLNLADSKATVTYPKYLHDYPDTPDLTDPPSYANRPEARQLLNTILTLLEAAKSGQVRYTGGLPYQGPEAL